MSIAGPPSGTRMTFEEFMTLPDDGVHRELIQGVVRVFASDADEPSPAADRVVTVRSRSHSRLLVTMSCELELWLRQQPHPRGEFVGGKCGFRLGGAGDTAVGIDLAYASAEQVAAMDAMGTPPRVFVGPPSLAIEILSPSDVHPDVVDMIKLYRKFGLILWLADPDRRTISVHRPGHFTNVFTESQDLVADPYLPGFRVPVSRFFS